MVKFSSIEYSRMKTSIDDKMADTKPELPEYEELELISKKLENKIKEVKEKELLPEGESKKQKKLWECTHCNDEVTISMIKKCNVCGNAGENIKEILLV
jgi:rubrerythrin